jgi:hypothetical protein
VLSTFSSPCCGGVKFVYNYGTQVKVMLLQSVPGHCRAHGGREDGGQRDGDTQVRGSIPFNPKNAWTN